MVRLKFKILSAIVLMLALNVSCNSGNGKTTGDINNSNKQVERKGNKISTIEMNKAMFLEKIVNYEKNPNDWKYLGDKPAIIDFYATWCGPCRAMSPRLEQVAEEYGGKIVVYKVDVDKEQELAGKFGIQSIPSLLFIPMNEKPQMAMGAIGLEDLKREVAEVLKVK